jgi:hypothetical protein
VCVSLDAEPVLSPVAKSAPFCRSLGMLWAIETSFEWWWMKKHKLLFKRPKLEGTGTRHENSI